jgi:REP element-mobilizing transposase RayT
MPRLPRIYIKGILYYITCRGMHNQNIFKDQKDYQMFLELLEKYQQQYGIKLFSFVLLPGHLHLLLEVTGEKDDISGFMHNLNNAYTKYFNSRYQRKGHLFRGRFKAALVEKSPNLAKLTAYMHLNPKRLNLTFDAKNYPYSSYGYYLKHAGEKQFTPTPKSLVWGFNIEQEITEVLNLLKGKGYEEFVNELTKDEADKLHKRLQRGAIVGSGEFINRIKNEAARYQLRSANNGTSGRQPRYKLFILTGGLVLLLVTGLSGIYFYLVAKDTGISMDNHQIITQAIRRAEELDATEWQIRLTPASGGKQTADTISFSQGQFISGKLNTQGFIVSNYSLTIEDSGKIVWETMQTGPQGTASWRGEIEGNKMQGILSLRSGDEAQDFSFISIRYRRRE